MDVSERIHIFAARRFRVSGLKRRPPAEEARTAPRKKHTGLPPSERPRERSTTMIAHMMKLCALGCLALALCLAAPAAFGAISPGSEAGFMRERSAAHTNKLDQLAPVSVHPENAPRNSEAGELAMSRLVGQTKSLDQAEAALLSIVAALEDPGKGDLDPQAVNRALQAVGDNILNNSNAATTATVAGKLHQVSTPNIGSFAFQVNLGSGHISKARMSGSDPNNIWGGVNTGGSFDLSGGIGKLSGNDFSVGGLAGNMTNSFGTVTGPAVGSLSGTATDGFKGLSNNSIANGKYTVTQPDGTGIDSGTITGGRVN